MSDGRAALLVATYEYEDPGLIALRAPEGDATAFAQVLMDPELAGYDVTVLVNQPHDVVGQAIEDFYQNRHRHDVTLLYFTGHGLIDDDGRLYFAMKNTRLNSLLFTGIAAEQIDAAMEASPSQQKILILDCSFGGAFPAGRAARKDAAVQGLRKLRGRGRVVLAASHAPEYGFEGDSTQGDGLGSVFTKYLVEGMKTGRADLDADGNISSGELYFYVLDRVTDEMPQQRLEKYEEVEGGIVIGRNINWTLPTYLTNAIGSPIARDRLAAIEGLAHLYSVGNPLVKSRALEQMTLLGNDDSRSVSTAAQQWLRQQNADEPVEERSVAGRPSDTDRGRLAAAVVDENVQFTVYRPNAVQPEIWYPLLAFAHLAERRADAPRTQPDPIEEVRALAARALGEEAAYGAPRVDARGGVPREGELRFVPFVEGVDFNPRWQTFEWQEDVHQQDFRLRARSSTEGRGAAGAADGLSGGVHHRGY